MATILAGNDDSVVEAENWTPTRPRFSWAATLAGAVAALAVACALVVFGNGMGLLPGHPDSGAFITLGTIFFVASTAFGFAAGGHVAGRIIGPHLESASEENVRAGVHGLVVWSLAAIVWTTVFAMYLASDRAHTPEFRGNAPAAADNLVVPPPAYWVDLMFRPQTVGSPHASLDGAQFAQVDTGQATDATTAPPPADTSQPQQPNQSEGQNGVYPDTSAPLNGLDENAQQHRQPVRHLPGDLAPPPQPPVPQTPANLGADKDEVGRIFEADLSRGGFLSVDDRDRVAQLVAQDANLSYETATTRVNDIQSRMHNARAAAVAGREQALRYDSLWFGIALLLGAVVSVAAAITARWEDDLPTAFAAYRAKR